jgi:hypothetical protein
MGRGAQSGERFHDRDNAIGEMKAQTVRPEIAGEPRLIGLEEFRTQFAD